MFRNGCLTLLILAAGLGGTGRAEAQTWVPVGPPGGSVRSLAADPRDPDRIYLGTEDGTLYRSKDGGVTWYRPEPGFPFQRTSLDEIVVDPAGELLVAYWSAEGKGGGIARSPDGGGTFALLPGLDGESVRALALAPADPSTIAAGTLHGVFLSRDAGGTWTRISPEDHPELRNVESLAFDRKDPRVLYVGTWHLGWKTQDAGATWFPVHQGMIDDSHVMTLTLDRRNPSTVYATACTGIYRSTQGGLRWAKLQGIPESSRRTRAFAQGIDDPRLLLAGTTEGLWLSEDQGVGWRRVTSDLLVVNAILVRPDGTILLGTEGAGVLRSSDRGRTWIAQNGGFSERFVSAMQFAPKSGSLLAGVWGDTHHGGVFEAARIPGPWTQIETGLEGRQILSLALLSGATLVGTDDGIYERGSGDTTWSRVRLFVDRRELHARVTQLLTFPPDRFLAGTSEGVLESVDGGVTWTRTLGRPGKILGLAASSQSYELVAAATPHGFFRSRDGGRTWRQLSSELPGVTPHALAFLPTSDRILFATTSGGLYRSDDQGVGWHRVAGGIPRSDLTGIALHPDGRTIYVSNFSWGGIFRSQDGGRSWKRMPTQGLASDRVWTMALDPAAPERLFVASSAGGLHLAVMSATAPGTPTAQ